ncbi:helix-turn-helix domain-containing protein [Singulisphaera sp. PoT]|uniref:helix-turn-helix domain-containing protein n=1 Tax=Singulisphaera sp. PoT TaxID=3411797 RepID=UPI003BF51241
MARKKVAVDEPIGPLLAQNLYRLGYGDIVIRSADIARLVAQKTGESFSRQRVSSILNAVRVEPETIELLASALGVSPDELTKKQEG